MKKAQVLLKELPTLTSFQVIWYLYPSVTAQFSLKLGLFYVNCDCKNLSPFYSECKAMNSDLTISDNPVFAQTESTC